MTEFLRANGYGVNRKRVQRLMGVMGLEITKPNQVWSTDITYIRLLLTSSMGHPKSVFLDNVVKHLLLGIHFQNNSFRM